MVSGYLILPLDERVNRPRISESQVPVSLLRSIDAMRFSWLLFLLSLTDLFCVSYSLSTSSSPSTVSSFLFGFSSPPRQRSLVLCAARYQRPFENYSDHDEISLQRSTDRPTETFPDLIGPSVFPAKPKIVVLGATGKIGRLVVKQLLEMKSADDMTVVALVRNYDKAIHVLYDELILVRGRSGPKLQIIEGDLVPPEELPGFEANQEEEEIWKQTASSRKGDDNRRLLPDVNEALENAIRDCTTIISCVGSVRQTNLWTDILQRPPWRLLKADVSGWCQDGSHPFYVHYASTRKAIAYAEREQLRREATALADTEELDQEEINVPRIRFVRISDLVVAHKAWHFVPVITNAVHSMVFRYQEMTEKLLESSSMLETVVLRPGDLVDDDRVSSHWRATGMNFKPVPRNH
jgi:NAD(P)-dependent dehydrogenase (short-subunit alcohol dehydrogenase family)